MSASQLPADSLRDRFQAILDEIHEQIDALPRPDHTLPGEEADSLLKQVFEAMAGVLVAIVERIQERLEQRPQPK